MKKSRGQSVVDFVMLTLLAVGIIIFGLYKFGDSIANFFARNDVENKFNSARTIKFEKPQDLVSSVRITYNGGTIVPPVEKIVQNQLAGGSYIQTSGSASRMIEMAKIMEEYINLLVDNAPDSPLITSGPASANALIAELISYRASVQNTLDQNEAILLGGGDILEEKINLVRMAASSVDATSVSTIRDILLPDYVGDGAIDATEKAIVEAFVTDLINMKGSSEYFIDPFLYVEYLSEEKRDDQSQDRDLMDAIQSAGLTADEKAEVAGLIKVFYGSGYSQISPKAYNGRQMCGSFGGTPIDNPNYPATDDKEYLCAL